MDKLAIQKMSQITQISQRIISSIFLSGFHLLGEILRLHKAFIMLCIL